MIFTHFTKKENHQTLELHIVLLTIYDQMDKKDPTKPLGRSTSHRKKGKGLLHKRESAKEFAVRTKIKYASCMDPLLEGDRLKEGELAKFRCSSTHESVTNLSV